MSKVVTPNELEELISEYEYTDIAEPEGAEEPYYDVSDTDIQGFPFDIPEEIWTQAENTPEPEAIGQDEENITEDAAARRSPDSALSVLRDQIEEAGYEVYDGSMELDPNIIVLFPNGYAMEIEESSIEETGENDLLQWDEQDDPEGSRIYKITATDNNMDPIDVYDGKDTAFMTERVLYAYIAETAGFEQVPREVEEEIGTGDDRGQPGDDDDSLIRKIVSEAAKSREIPESEVRDRFREFQEEYRIHDDARTDNGAPASGEAMRNAVNRALYEALGRSTRTDIVDTKQGQNLQNDAVALAQSMYMKIRQDMDLREAAQNYAAEMGWIGEGKRVTNVRLGYNDARSGNKDEVNDIFFRLIIEPDNRRQRTREASGEEREIRYFNLPEDERDFWVDAVNNSAAAIMRGEDHIGLLMDAKSKDGVQIFRDIDTKEREARAENRKEEAPSFGSQETKDEDKAAEDAYWDSRAREQTSQGKTELVSFAVLTNNGERQDVRGAVVDREHRSIGLAAVETKSRNNYELKFSGELDRTNRTPIYSTEQLFTPHESIYFSDEVKSMIAKYVARSTAKAVNEYYSSDDKNKHGTFDIVGTAQKYKKSYIEKVMSLEDGRCSSQAFEFSSAQNRRDAEDLLRVMGFRFDTDLWRPSLTSVEVERSGATERIPVLHLENVGNGGRGADMVKAAASALGMDTSYDRSTGILNMWMRSENEPQLKAGYWEDEKAPTNEDFNRMLLRLAEARTQADKNGRSIDAKKGVIVPEQEVWELVRNTVKPESLATDEEEYSKESKEMAGIYLKAMGLNLGKKGRFDFEHYPLRHMNGHKMQLYEVPLMNDGNKSALVVTVAQVTENQFAAAESYLTAMGLHYTYDKDDHMFTVSYSPEGRPAFERLDTYRNANPESFKDAYREAAANTIGSLEGRHLITTSLYRSGVLRGAVLRGYSEAEGKDMERRGVSEKDIKHETQNIRSNGQLYFYTMPMEQEITKHRDETLNKYQQVAHLSSRAQDQMGRVAGGIAK